MMFRVTAFIKRLLRCGLFFFIFGSVFLIPSCGSQADPYALDITSKEYFQRGIEASDKNNYKLALQYYDAYLKKYPWQPEDTENIELLSGNLWASYEIAFAYYKMKKDRTAVELLEELLDRYDALQQREDIDPNTIPQGPLILGELVLEKIRNRNPKAFKPQEEQTQP